MAKARVVRAGRPPPKDRDLDPFQSRRRERKRGKAEFRKYVDIAIGSYAEAEYQLRLGHELGFLPIDRHTALKLRFDELGRCLYDLVRSLGS